MKHALGAAFAAALLATVAATVAVGANRAAAHQTVELSPDASGTVRVFEQDNGKTIDVPAQTRMVVLVTDNRRDLVSALERAPRKEHWDIYYLGSAGEKRTLELQAPAPTWCPNVAARSLFCVPSGVAFHATVVRPAV